MTDSRWLAWSVPFIYVLAALAAPRVRHPWRALSLATGAALALAFGRLLLVFASAIGTAGAIGTRIASVLVLLITFLGWVIGRYSRVNLAGEPGERRYVLGLLATLAAVCTVVSTNDFAVLIAAWAASSVTLHPLLTFYGERPLARLAARKKFMAARLAELCLLGAAALLYLQWRTLDLGSLARLATASASLPAAVECAAVLIAAAVVLRCAQLPLHGWLVQVMEAPSSVSALLHAGVVNLGGYVLIRLAPLLCASAPAELLLVAVGSATAVLAGLTMMTCTSVKVRLAWSTCSQMGLMLTECGLGLYDLALLHLLAHALYKAYAFLSAGEVVQESANGQPRAQSAPGVPHLLAGRLLAAPLAALLVIGSSSLWHTIVNAPQLSGPACLIGSIGCAVLLWNSATLALYLRNIMVMFAAVQLYLLWHLTIRSAFPVPTGSASGLAMLWAGGCFLMLYVLQWQLARPVRSPGAARLRAWASAGYFLDEPMTALVMRRGRPRPPRWTVLPMARGFAQREGGAA